MSQLWQKTLMQVTSENSRVFRDKRARQALLEEFSKRTQNNSRYSLRAYARSLGVSHAFLSMILNGKRRVSEDLCHLMDVENNSLHEIYSELKSEDFQVVSTWVHHALLNMVSLKGFKVDFRKISKSLNLSPLVVTSVWQDLVRGGFVKKEKMKWVQTKKKFTFNNSQSTETTRSYIKGYLKKAEQSMENDPFEIRNLTTITFAMNEKDIPEAIEKITSFRRHLCSQLEKTSKPNRIYSLSIQLFPLTNDLSEGVKQ